MDSHEKFVEKPTIALRARRLAALTVAVAIGLFAPLVAAPMAADAVAAGSSSEIGGSVAGPDEPGAGPVEGTDPAAGEAPAAEEAPAPVAPVADPAVSTAPVSAPAAASGPAAATPAAATPQAPAVVPGPSGGSASTAGGTDGDRSEADGPDGSDKGDRMATLTLVKKVEGGSAPASAWLLSAKGPGGAVLSGHGGATGQVPAGSYDLSETGDRSGYVAGSWECVGGSLKGSTVTLSKGKSVTCTITNVYRSDRLATLTLVKKVQGGSAPASAWLLTADGPGGAVLSGNGGATGQVPAGSYDLSESGDFSGYVAGSWKCVGGSLKGATVTLHKGKSVTCTITNVFKGDRMATLTLVKEVEGGPAEATDWVLTAEGPDGVVLSGAGGATGQVPAGSYDLSESDGPSSYVAGSWKCVGGSLKGSTVTVRKGKSVTCTITNVFKGDRMATLTLVKKVEGGSAEATAWELTAEGPDGVVLSGAGGATGQVPAGSYDLSESDGPSGYVAGDWVCDGRSLKGSTVTLHKGKSVTCTITNVFKGDRMATLTLVKKVEGGSAQPSDWVLTADGPGDAVLTGAGGATGQVPAGSYDLSESDGPSGYVAGSWKCVGGSLKGSTVTVHKGKTVTCTIVNVYKGHGSGTLTLVKKVTNDDGGTAPASAWTLTAEGPGGAGVSGPGGATGQVPAGSYDLSESGGPDGYAAGSWRCFGGSLKGATVTVRKGQSVTCKIVNDDIAPTLTLVKEVEGGPAEARDWVLAAKGATSISGRTGDASITDAAVRAGSSYRLSESGGPSGYTASDWVCEGGSLKGSTLRLSLGADVTCTITNVYKGGGHGSGTLTLVKKVTNDDGGTAQPSAWTLAAVGPGTTLSGPGGATGQVPAGSYDLSESGGPDGYAAGSWRCFGGSLKGATVTVRKGQSVTCKIVNDDIAPTLTLVKQVVNNNGGSAVATAWTLAAAGPTPISGQTGDAAITAAAVRAGSYTLSESGGPAGYTAGAWDCTSGTLVGSTITLAPGAAVTCTIVNDDDAGAATLTLVKEVVNNNGGNAAATAWTLAAAGPTSFSGVTGTEAVTAVPVVSGSYALSESGGPTGYTASAWSCTSGTLVGSTITLAPGAAVTCTIVNDDDADAATLTLVKEVVNNNGGSAVATAWTLAAAGATSFSGVTGTDAVTAVPVVAGSYGLSESGGPAGYTAGSWACEGGSLAGSTITLAPGAAAVCTIINDDDAGAATLTLVKEVVNDNGGTALETDWVLAAAGPTSFSGRTGETAVTAVPVVSGSYTLSESDGPAGYTAGSWACEGGSLAGSTVTLAPGAAAVCTIINDDDAGAATLTLVKEVVNNDGGNAVATAWTLAAAGPTSFSGVTGTDAVTAVAVVSGSYTLSESGGPAGYTAGSWACEGGSLAGSTVTLAPGAAAVCTIVNTYEQAPVGNGLVSAEKSVWELINGAWVVSDGRVSFGDTIQYRIAVAASGDAASDDVLVVDRLQDGLTSTAAATCSITCTATFDTATATHRIELGTMQPGDTAVVSFLAKVPAAPSHAPGTTVTASFDNVAAVSSASVPETPTNTVTVTPNQPLAPVPQLPRTGAGVPGGLIGVAMALMVAGGLLLLRRRDDAAA